MASYTQVEYEDEIEGESSKSTYTRIDADILIPGRGEPLLKASLVMCDDAIEWVGLQDKIPKKWPGLETPSKSVPVLMPGLWDCHVHFRGLRTAKIFEHISTPQALAGARLARDAMATLNAGFTSVREMGGYGVELRQAIEEGWLIGPHIYPAVSPICMTDYDGAALDLPVNRVVTSFHPGAPLYLCPGVHVCRETVRYQINRGADIINICATGGAKDVAHVKIGFSLEETRVMVDQAERGNKIVAAHCHGTLGVLKAIRAGCKTIEYGSSLTDEAIELMVDKDVMLVSNLSTLERRGGHPEVFDTERFQIVDSVDQGNANSVANATKAGVKIALGSGLGLSALGSTFNHGTNGLEFVNMVNAGMTPSQAIEAGTANGPITLGPWNILRRGHGRGRGRRHKREPGRGRLRAGYYADVIAASANPLEDIKILSDPLNITHVWKGGKLFKSPEKPLPW